MLTVNNGLIAIVVICLALALSGCGQGGNTSGSSEPVTNGSVSDGETIFASRCAACHSIGSDTRYGPGMAGLFAPDNERRLPNGEPITEDSVSSWILSGGEGETGVMPPQNLNNRQLADVIAYLKTLTIP